MAIPPSVFPTVVIESLGVGRPQRAGPDRRREAVRPRPGQSAKELNADAARGLPRGAHLPHRPLPRQGERRGPAGVPLLQHRCSSRCGTATTCAACRSRWPRRSASRAAGASTTRSARSATWCRTTCCRSWPCWRWSPRSVPRPSYLQDEKAKVFAATETDRLRATSCAASTSATSTSPASRRARTTETFVAARLRDRLVAVGGRAVVRARRQGARPGRHRGRGRVRATRPACCSTRPAGHGPSRNLVRFRLGRRDGVTFTLQAKTPGEQLDSQDVEPRGRLRRRPRRALATPTSACSATPCRQSRGASPARTWSSRRGAIVQPALDEHGPVYPYARGSWGPPEADALVPDGWYPPS